MIVDGGASSGPVTDDAGSSGYCKQSASLNEAGSGVQPCGMGRAIVKCMTPGGGGCLCVSDDPTGCGEGCGEDSGATCENQCGPNEYAVSCGGVDPFGQFQDAPDACVQVAGVEGLDFSCCPCQ
jgi:hypothetical protein